MYNVYHGIVPDIFKGMFVYNNMIHYHDPRISGHLHPPTISSNLSQNSIRYNGVIIWNKILTAAINPDSSEVSFKIMLKKWIQQEVITHSSLTQNIAIANYLFLHNSALCTLHWFNADHS